jgi:glucokinase
VTTAPAAADAGPGRSFGSERTGVVAGVDIGGTKTAVCLASLDGALLREAVWPTDATSTETVVDGARRALAALLQDDGRPRDALHGIGVCAPGRAIDAKAIVSRYNLTGRGETMHLGPAFEQAFGVPVQVENDANAAALGELCFGAARGRRHAVFVTVSTGIGSGLIVDGAIYRGGRGLAGEIAHLSVDVDSARTCRCGAVGCVEALASGAAIAAAAAEALALGEASSLQDHFADHGAPPASLVLAAAAAGDPLARRVADRAGAVLGTALAGAASLLDPEVIVLGGGVMQAGDVIWRPLLAAYRHHGAVANDVAVVAAELDQRAGVLGAAALVLQRERRASDPPGGNDRA